MGYWKDKVLPKISKIKKVFEKDNTARKAAAAEAVKSFDDTKDDIIKEFDEKKAELQAKVLEIYEASAASIKNLVKEPKEAGLRKYSASVQKFLDELAKIEFPGSKLVSEASSKYGPAYVYGPVSFVFEKVSSFIPVKVEKEAEPAAAETSKAEEGETTTTEVKEKEIAVEEVKKEEVAEPAAPAAAEPPVPAAAAKAEEPVAEPAKA